jgi:hypothetical protein
MAAISLVAIVRNESRSLLRMLTSARNLVDEMVVVDTGSTDGTQDIARAAGARVEHFPWCGDFAAARNHALSFARHPWRLVLDADEWLDEPACDVATLRASAPDFVGQICVVNTFDSAQGMQSERLRTRTWISRLLPVGVHYAGAIHEQPQHAFAVRRVPLVALHDGYEDAQLTRKGDRNLQLLARLIDAGHNEPYLIYQYARELDRTSADAAAAQHYARALAQVAPEAPWHEALVCAALQSFGKTGELEIAFALIEAQSLRYAESADFWFCVGCFLMDAASVKPQLATQFMTSIENSFLRCLEIGERPEKSDGVEGRGSFLAAQNLYALYAATGRDERAEHYRQLAQRA